MVLKFLKKTLILFCLVTTFIVFYLIIYKNQISKITVSKNINVIVCGDSHTQTAINDSKLIHTLNISQNSEPYLATFNVIKTLTKNNTQIKTIVLGYSFHSLSNVFDDIIYKEKHKTDFYARYLPILDLESISLISKRNLIGVIQSFPLSLNTWITIRHTLKQDIINYNDYKFFGKYYRSKKSNCNTKYINLSIIRHYYNKKKIREFSNIQIKYLLEIATYCKKNRLNLILLNTPVNNQYYKKIPTNFKKKYYSTFVKINTKAKLLDLHKFNLEKKHFGDGDHINQYGADLLNSSLKKMLIDNYKIKL